MVKDVEFVINSPHESISIRLRDSTNLKLVRCPPGEFCMGGGPSENTPGENPAHEVRINKEFWIGESLITRSQFSSVMRLDYNGVYENSPNCPASQLGWLKALEFCKKLEMLLQDGKEAFGLDTNLDYRLILPTEQQWEYACRAGTTTKWFFGDDQDELSKYAWYGRDVRDFSPLPQVMQKLPNPWGLYDLYGLVPEWCMNDPYNYRDTVIPSVSYPSKTASDHVFKALRGGGVYSPAWYCRSASRSMMSHWNTQNDLTGFRVVLTAK